MLFASEKQVSPTQTRYFSTKGFYSTQYYLVWTGVPVTLRWSKVAWLCSSPQLTWPHGLFCLFFINYSLSLILWRSVFEHFVQVFPCVHTLEDGAQVAHPIIFPDSQVFLFFYCFNCHDSEKSKLGVFMVLKFCYIVSHPTFCRFFQFCVWFMVSPASFQVGCRSYIPLVVYFAHNDVNNIWAWTGNVLLYGPLSTVPWRYKNSGFFWMATRVAPFFARKKKTWSVLGPVLNVFLFCGTAGLYICARFFLFLSAEIMVLGWKISLLTTLAWRRWRFFLIIAVLEGTLGS